MMVEVQMVGSPRRWLVNMDRGAIRIGRSPECEVELAAEEFPEVSREHAMVVLAGGELRLFDRQSGNGTFVNAESIEAAVLTAGDMVRLGAGGPELMFRLVPAGDAPTVVAAAAPGGGAAPGMTIAAPPLGRGPHPSGEGGRAATGPTPTLAYPHAAAAPAPSPPAPARAAAPASRLAGGALGMDGGAAANRSAAERAVLEQALARLKSLVLVTLALALAACGLAGYLAQQLSATRDDLARIHGEAVAAIAQVQPTFERDQRQLQSLNGQLQQQEQVAEDHFIARMNQQLPELLDRYMDAKAKQMGLSIPPSTLH